MHRQINFLQTPIGSPGMTVINMKTLAVRPPFLKLFFGGVTINHADILEDGVASAIEQALRYQLEDLGPLQ
jgi:hypothetical protein